MMVEGPENRSAIPIQVLVNSQDRFLGFLEQRVDGRETARDILQRAYLTGLERQGTLRNPERVVAWFYRLLRNAIIDHYRHTGVESRALERFRLEQAGRVQPEPELERQICSCISDLIPSLRPEYAELIRDVDLAGQEIAQVAKRLQITANNARVRLFRARRALRRALIETCGVCAQHACLDCGCLRN